MTSSLLVGPTEILAGGKVQPAGWVARLAAGWDFGSAQPNTTFVSSLLDGERASGLSSSDRTISLPIIVLAPNLAGSAARLAISNGIAALQQTVNGLSFPVTWTPDTSAPLPVVFDAFRGTSAVEWSIGELAEGIARVTLSFTALPYGRSASQEVITASAGTSTVIDDLETATGMGWYRADTSALVAQTGQDTDHTSGTYSQSAVSPSTGVTWQTLYAGVAVPRTFGSTLDLSAVSAIVLDVKAPADLSSWVLVLVDNVGAVATATAAALPDPNSWRSVSWSIGAFSGVDLTHITGWGLYTNPFTTPILVNNHGGASASPKTVKYDNLRTYSGTQTTTGTDAQGSLYLVPAVKGTARAPVRIQAVGPVTGSEQAANGTFETNVTGWAVSGATIARSTAQAHSGSASALVTWANGLPSANSTSYITTTLTGSTLYLMSGWVYVPAGSPRVQLAAVGPGFTSASSPPSLPIVGWQQLLLGFTTASSPGTVAYGIQNADASTSGQIAYLDDVSIKAAVTISAALLHKAPPQARPDYTPLIPYGVSLGTYKAMPNYQSSALGVRYAGWSHSIALGTVVLSGATFPRTLTATFRFGGNETLAVARTITSSGEIINGMLPLGTLTLPNRVVPAENTTRLVEVKVDDTGSGSTTVADVLALDTRGQTVLVQQAFGRQFLWVDEPDPTSSLGQVYVGFGSDRSDAVAAWDATTATGGPFSLDPGDNLLLAYSPQGQLGMIATYSPRWLSERTA